LNSWVYSGDANNLLGGLTFVYQVHLTAGQFNQLALNGWNDGKIVDVGYNQVVATQKIPLFVGRPDLSGNPIDWNFGLEITSGDTALLIVQSSDTRYRKVTDVVQDGGQAKAVAFAPAVPDGGMTAILLGLGFLGVAGLRRKLS
jgi:hypothetical protein